MRCKKGEKDKEMIRVGAAAYSGDVAGAARQRNQNALPHKAAAVSLICNGDVIHLNVCVICKAWQEFALLYVIELHSFNAG